jgi:phosphopantothenoylcysteine decarboxylase/phosphopantothenate--cysteine ligase
VRVETAEEMRTAVLRAAEHADAVVMAAAVADFRPTAPAPDKLKKELGPPELHLEPTPDILAELGSRRPEGLVLVGFAAETAGTEEALEAGRRKFASKGLDLLVVNEVGRPGTGFGAETNRAAILGSDGAEEPLREWTKAELARAICDRLAALLARPVR